MRICNLYIGPYKKTLQQIIVLVVNVPAEHPQNSLGTPTRPKTPQEPVVAPEWA